MAKMSLSLLASVLRFFRSPSGSPGATHSVPARSLQPVTSLFFFGWVGKKHLSLSKNINWFAEEGAEEEKAEEKEEEEVVGDGGDLEES